MVIKTFESLKLNEEVLNHFGYVRQQLSAGGGNDSEFDRLNEIEERYRRGEMIDEAAKIAAQAIVDGKIER